MRHNNHYCHFGCKTTMTVIIAPPECLIAQGYYILIWHTFVDLRLSRRELAEEVLNIFRDACCVRLLTHEKDVYHLPEFDDVFTEDDSRRWFGQFTRPDETGESPAHYTKAIPRLEVLDAAAKIINPEPFKAIGHTC